MRDLDSQISIYADYSNVTIYSFLHNADFIIKEWSSYLKFNRSRSEYRVTKIISSLPTLVNDLNAIINLDDFVEWYSLYMEDQAQHFRDGHNFNIFNLLRNEFDFKIQETMHSKLIKFLLDSNESHGQKDIFLLEFLRLLNIESPEIGKWKVSAEQGKIDVLIERDTPHSVIIIENKSNWANDQPNQLYRYWYRAIYLKTKEVSPEFYKKNKHKYQIIYLAPNSYKCCNEQSLTKPQEDVYSLYRGLPNKIPMSIKNLTFDEEIQFWLEECKNMLPKTNHRIREYISQYQLLCKTL